MEKTLTPIKSRITKMITVVDTLIVKDEKTQAEATTILSGIKDVQKKIKLHKDARVKPINQSLKLIRADYKPLEEYCSEAENTVKQKMIEYHRIQETERIAKEEKLAKRVEKGTMKMETATKKLEEEPEVKTHIATDKGSATIRKVKMFKVVDIISLPIEFHLPDITAIRRKMSEGVEVAGVKYWTEDSISAR